MIEINGEKWEIIYHWCYNGNTSCGIYVPIMLRKVVGKR